MSALFIQVVLARNGDDAEWMQLLVFIVLAVVYGLGSILKARTSKTELEEEKDVDISREKQQRLQGRLQRLKAVLPQLVEQEQPQRQPVQPRLEEAAEIIPMPLETIKERPIELLGETKQLEAIFEPVLNLDKPDELKRAILYCEILGKPVALREQPR